MSGFLCNTHARGRAHRVAVRASQRVCKNIIFPLTVAVVAAAAANQRQLA